MVELLDCRTEGAAGRESTDVQFQKRSILPWPAKPVGRLPAVLLVIDDFAWPGNVAGLKMRGRVRHVDLAIDAEFVQRARSGLCHGEFVPAAGPGVHAKWTIQNEIDAVSGRSPEPKDHSGFSELRPKARAIHADPENTRTDR